MIDDHHCHQSNNRPPTFHTYNPFRLIRVSVLGRHRAAKQYVPLILVGLVIDLKRHGLFSHVRDRAPNAEAVTTLSPFFSAANIASACFRRFCCSP